MKHAICNDAAKIRMMAAQMRHHAMATTRRDYIEKFERAAAELEQKAAEAERRNRVVARRLDS